MTVSARSHAVILSLLIFVFIGCSGGGSSADEPAAGGGGVQQARESASPAVDTEVDASVLAMVKEYDAEPGQLYGYNEDGERVTYPGVTFGVPSDSNATEARKAVNELGARLEGSGYEVFIVEQAFGMGEDRLAVMQTDDRFEMLLVMQTGGYNYDIFPKDVQAKLNEWDESFGIYLIGAGPDWAQLEFVGRPGDMDAFANEVYEFCPDMVDQGSGSVEGLAKEMSDTGTIYLWWD